MIAPKNRRSRHTRASLAHVVHAKIDSLVHRSEHMAQETEDQLSLRVGIIEAVAKGKFSISLLVGAFLVVVFATLVLGLTWNLVP
jgi:hypothetical protein